MKNLTALIVGATGLAGRHCLHYLLQDPEYSAVTVLNRRSLGQSHTKLQEHIIDFENLEGFRPFIQGNHIFCGLGTTIKQAGSQSDFRKGDYTYPLTLARIALEKRAHQFVLVSALGANENSRIFFTFTSGKIEKVPGDSGPFPGCCYGRDGKSGIKGNPYF